MFDIIDLTAGATEIIADDGDVIVREGDRTGSLFVLIEGELEVRRRGQLVATLTDRGAIVGELGLLLDAPASADVIAVGRCTVRRMDDAHRTFAENPEFARHLATLLARRLLQVSTYLVDMQEQYAHRDDTLGLMPTVLSDLLGDHRLPAEPGSERETDSPY